MEDGIRKAADELKDIGERRISGTALSEFVKRRVQEFRTLGSVGRVSFDFRPFADIVLETGIFGELCFCILTANSSAELGIRIQNELGDEGFANLSEEELSKVFGDMGHRFARIRARYIVLARSFDPQEVLRHKSGKMARTILMRLKGLGMKESSHFLRNIGYSDVAIVDRHVYRFLLERGLVPARKSMSPTLYLECERVLEKISHVAQIDMPSLDLYIFFRQTGKVLK